MTRIAKLTIPLLPLGMAIIGCTHADEPVVETAPAIASVAPEVSLTSTATQPAVTAGRSPDLAEPEPTRATVAAFTPPFPTRLELFEPPPRAQSTMRRDDEHGQTVELKGFIYVDQPRVVLSIDGVVCSIPQDGEKYGVQVISIEPPTVVLQRGRNRWPATLE